MRSSTRYLPQTSSSYPEMAFPAPGLGVQVKIQALCFQPLKFLNLLDPTNTNSNASTSKAPAPTPKLTTRSAKSQTHIQQVQNRINFGLSFKLLLYSTRAGVRFLGRQQLPLQQYWEVVDVCDTVLVFVVSVTIFTGGGRRLALMCQN